MKLYNSYSTKKEEINEKIYKIYNCGPTVYNYVHIGNIRPLITFDILYRFLLSQNKKVEYVLNITDVDDKIIDKAIKEKKTEKEISTKYAKAYFDLFKKLNVLNQSYNPLVSENIKGIEEYIDKLINNGSAYLTKEGDAYFDIGKFKNEYGKLSKQNIANLLEGVRKENSNDKHNPLDFVL
jgi:cysteinyl-tRNA synthetase